LNILCLLINIECLIKYINTKIILTNNSKGHTEGVKLIKNIYIINNNNNDNDNNNNDINKKMIWSIYSLVHVWGTLILKDIILLLL